MSAPPSAWADRLAVGQVVVGRPSLMLWWPGREPAPVTVLDSPSSRMDSGQAARRELTVRVPSSEIPAGADASARVMATLLLDAGAGRVEPVVQLVGQLASSPEDDEPGVVRIVAQSREAVILAHGLTRPRTIGQSALGSLRQLVSESLPGEYVTARGVSDVAIRPMTLEPGPRARWDAIAKLAAILGCEFGAARGGQLRLMPVADADRGEPWQVRDVAPLPRRVAPPQPNVVVVTGPPSAANDDSPTLGIAIDDRPGSPNYVGRGVVSRYLSSPGADLIADEGRPLRTRHEELPVSSSMAAQLAARTLLLRGDRSADVAVTVPCNPWADWGDRAVIRDVNGALVSLIVTGLSPLPLIPTSLAVAGRME